jgi:D-alanyl-lipoteichoic acid acyltransferase DltB (MBOAT superfamily)
MLFHSKEFLLYFLPGTFLVWLCLTLLGRPRIALGWLTIASLAFYACWNPPYLALLVGSLAWNFSFGKLVDPALGRPPRTRTVLLWIGVAANLALLGYFKYANFFVDTMNAVVHLGWTFEKILLPLGISFYTFQQIAYLVDAYRGKAKGHSLLDYVFFVTFFPQLIAGPIVHHAELIPQTLKKFRVSEIPGHLVIGVSIFIIGLFKKFVLADTCGEIANPFFSAVAEGSRFDWMNSWCGVLAYGFQIYFDFSGYSDMAVGLGRIFGYKMPENFSAPYRATSIVEFWRRWHMTLSRFLRDYLYIPLGGNRHGALMRYRNLMLTMLLGGLWHGAGWTFVIWGGLHGIYLSVNHLWSRYAPRALTTADLVPGIMKDRVPGIKQVMFWSLSMLCVTIAWVFFRADSVTSSFAILSSMFGMEPGKPMNPALLGEAWKSYLRWPWLILMEAIVLLAPTTQSYFRAARPTLETEGPATSWWHWRPNLLHAVLIGMLLIPVARRYFSLAPTEFLYFNF